MIRVLALVLLLAGLDDGAATAAPRLLAAARCDRCGADTADRADQPAAQQAKRSQHILMTLLPHEPSGREDQRRPRVAALCRAPEAISGNPRRTHPDALG